MNWALHITLGRHISLGCVAHSIGTLPQSPLWQAFSLTGMDTDRVPMVSLKGWHNRAMGNVH